MHFVMTQAAELGAQNVVATDLRSGEVNRDDHAGHGVLLQAELAHVEIVNDVLGANQEFDFTVHGNGEGGNDDVVLGVGIRRIEAHGIAGRSADLLGIQASKFAVGASVTEIEDELVGGDFDLQGVGAGGLQVGDRPGVVGHQAQTDEQDDGGGGPDRFKFGVSVVVLGLLSAVAIAKDHPGQAELGKNKDDAGDDQGEGVLMVHLLADLGDWRRSFEISRGENVRGDHHEKNQQK